MKKTKDRYKHKKEDRYYTYRVYIDLQVQHTFSQDEIESDFDGQENAYEPTGGAMEELKDGILERLSDLTVIDNIEVYTESDCLLGTDPPLRAKRRAKRNN